MIGKTNAISGVSDPVPKIRTVSGSVISIYDALAMPAVSLIADINAVQSGSGDPSPDNVRPITGWTEAKVWRTGKNLIDDSKRYVYAETTVYVGAESRDYTVALRAGTYTISADFSGERYGMYYREANDTANRALWTSSGDTEKTFTIEKDGVFRFWVYRGTASGSVDPTKIIHVQIEKGSTATAYESYNGNTYTIQLGQTVYGGSLDVTTGVLTVDRAIVDLGSLNWSYFTNNKRFAVTRSDGKQTGTGKGGYGICSSYPVSQDNYGVLADKTLSVGSNFISGSTCSIVVHDESYTDATSFKQAVSGVQLVYELATPQTVQLTPTQVQMLLGNNTLWADSGDSELQYWARR